MSCYPWGSSHYDSPTGLGEDGEVHTKPRSPLIPPTPQIYTPRPCLLCARTQTSARAQNTALTKYPWCTFLNIVIRDYLRRNTVSTFVFTSTNDASQLRTRCNNQVIDVLPSFNESDSSLAYHQHKLCMNGFQCSRTGHYLILQLLLGHLPPKMCFPTDQSPS